MESEDRSALTLELHNVSSNLKGLNQILSLLRTAKVITSYDEGAIRAEPGHDYEKNKALLDCLMRKRGSLQPFLDILRSDDVGHSELAADIERHRKIPQGNDRKTMHSSERHKRSQASGGTSEDGSRGGVRIDDTDKDEMETDIIDLGAVKAIAANKIAQYAFNRKRKAKILIINNIEFPKQMEKYLKECKEADKKPVIGDDLKKVIQERCFEEADKMSATRLCQFLEAYFKECKKNKTEPVTGKELDIASKWKRLGARNDEKAVKDLCEFMFPEWKAIDEENYMENKTAEEMEGILTKLAASIPESTPGVESADAVEGLFIFMMSHGSKADFIGSDGNPIHLLDVFKWFSPVNCPGLKGKPKVFFIQACRGGEHDFSSTIHMDMDIDGPPETAPIDISVLDDFLIAFSSGWGKKSRRDRTDGSYFIQVLKCVLVDKSNYGLSIEQVLKKVHYVMRSIFQNKEINTAKPGCKEDWKKITQSPGYYSHLSRDLILVPADFPVPADEL